MRDALRSYSAWVVRHRLAVIVAAVLVSAFLAAHARGVRVVIDPNTIMPQSHPFVVATNRIDSTFGSKFVIVVGLRPRRGDVYDPAVLDVVRRITERLRTADGVVAQNLLSLTSRRAKDIRATGDALEVRPLVAPAAVAAERVASLRESIARNPVYQDTVVSRDGRMAGIVVEMRERPGGHRAMFEAVKRAVEAEVDGSIDVLYGGHPVYLAHAEEFSDRIKLIFPLAALIIGLLHWEAFRTFQGFLLPLVTALLSVLWAIGIMGWAKVPLDVFNTPTMILVLAVAAGHAVQLLKRYYESYGALLARAPPGADLVALSREAVVDSVASVGPVMIVAGAVAALSFLSLMVFAISSIRVFGIFTATGIVSAMVLELTFIPAVRSVLRPPSGVERTREGRFRIWDRIPRAISRVVLGRRRRLVFVVAGALFALAVLGATRVRIENSNKSYFAEDLPFQADDRALNSGLAGTNTLHVLLEGAGPDAMKEPRVLAAIESIQRFAEAQPMVGKSVSIVDLVKRMHQAMHGDDPAFAQVPPDRDLVSQYLFLYSLSGEPDDFRSLVDDDYRTANVTIFLKTASTAYGRQLVDRVAAFARGAVGDGVQVGIGGSVPQTTALTEVMVHGKIRNIVQVVVILFLLTAVLFRSVVAGGLVLIPVVFTVVLNFGLMGLLGVPLNIPNSLSSAMAVGIGADYAIYFLFRLREELSSRIPFEQAMANTFASAGKASLYVATAVATGYGTMIFSPGFRVHNWYGVLIACAMVVSVMSTLWVIPAVLQSYRPRFVHRGLP